MNASQIKFALNNIYKKEISEGTFNINGILDLKKVPFIILDRDNNIYSDFKTRRFKFDFENNILEVYYGRYKNGEFKQNTTNANDYIAFSLLSSFITSEKVGDFGNIQPLDGVRVKGLPDEYIMRELNKRFTVKFYNGDTLLKTYTDVEAGTVLHPSFSDEDLQNLDRYFYDNINDCYRKLGWIEEGYSLDEDYIPKDISDVGKIVKNTNFYMHYQLGTYYKITFTRKSGDTIINSYDDYVLDGELPYYNGSLYTQSEIENHHYQLKWYLGENEITEFNPATSNIEYVVTDYSAISSYNDFSSAIDAVNRGEIISPTINITGSLQPTIELEINRSIKINGNSENDDLSNIVGANNKTTFVGYDATSKYCDAFYVAITEENQTIEVNNVVFDHFCYYSDVSNKVKATNSQVKNGVSILTYSGDCPASTTIKFTNCTINGTARDMINASSTKGCKGNLIFERCIFDATDRLSSTLNMLSFFGNQDGELNVEIRNCIFKEASEQNATWATSAIASFGNTNIVVENCEFISCQVAIAIDNTFDHYYSKSTYPCYKNTKVTKSGIKYTNCYFGYYEESIIGTEKNLTALFNNNVLVSDASLIPESFEYYDNVSLGKLGSFYEYDYVTTETQGIDYLSNTSDDANALYFDLICYYSTEQKPEENVTDDE